MGSVPTPTIGCACCCTAGLPGRLTEPQDREGVSHAWWRRANNGAPHSMYRRWGGPLLTALQGARARHTHQAATRTRRTVGPVPGRRGGPRSSEGVKWGPGTIRGTRQTTRGSHRPRLLRGCGHVGRRHSSRPNARVGVAATKATRTHNFTAYGRRRVTGTRPPTAGPDRRRRTHKMASDHRSYRSEAVTCRCSIVDPTYQHANRPLVVEGPTMRL